MTSVHLSHSHAWSHDAARGSGTRGWKSNSGGTTWVRLRGRTEGINTEPRQVGATSRLHSSRHSGCSRSSWLGVLGFHNRAFSVSCSLLIPGVLGFSTLLTPAVIGFLIPGVLGFLTPTVLDFLTPGVLGFLTPTVLDFLTTGVLGFLTPGVLGL